MQILHWSAAAGADDAGTITATLTVDAASSLPLSELTTFPGHRQRVTFGRWNQPVKVTAPRRSIPLPGS